MYINIATRAELESVPGLNPKTSLAIVEKRVVRPWTEENIFELARPGWPNQPFVEIFHFGIPGCYTFENQKPFAVKGTTGKHFCTPLERGQALLQRLEKYHNKIDVRRSLDSEIPAFGTCGQDQRSLYQSGLTAGSERDKNVQSRGETRQDCDFVQPGFTAGQYGSIARTEQDHMVRSMGVTGQDCELAQPGLTAGQYGSIARTEREHMVRSMGRAGQGCDHKVRPMGVVRQDCDPLGQMVRVDFRERDQGNHSRSDFICDDVWHFKQNVAHGLSAQTTGQVNLARGQVPNRNVLQLGQPNQENTGWVSQASHHQSGPDTSVLRNYWESQDPLEDQGQGSNHGFPVGDDFVGIPQSLSSKWKGGLHPQMLTDCTFRVSSSFLGRWEGRGEESVTQSGLPIGQGQDTNIQPLGEQERGKSCNLACESFESAVPVFVESKASPKDTVSELASVLGFCGSAQKSFGSVAPAVVESRASSKGSESELASVSESEVSCLLTNLPVCHSSAGHSVQASEMNGVNVNGTTGIGTQSSHVTPDNRDFPDPRIFEESSDTHNDPHTCKMEPQNTNPSGGHDVLDDLQAPGFDFSVNTVRKVSSGLVVDCILGAGSMEFAQSGIPTGQKLDTNIQPSGTVGKGSMVSSSVCLFQPDRGGIPMTSFLELAPRSA